MTVDNKPLPAIPAKRYFTIGEVSELCGVKAYVLRYWEQEFTQLKPMKRRGNRRYYQHHEVLLIRRIRDLLYEQGFTISGARNQLTDAGASHVHPPAADEAFDPDELDDETLPDAIDTAPMPLAPARDPGARTRVTDRGTIAELDDDALEAMARDDLAIIERAQRGVGEFATSAAHAVASTPAGSAGVRAAALQTRRTAPTASSTPSAASHGALATPDQIRAELLAIRALLVS
jgi:DNA-binding transcriptional MerR regulator